VALQKDLTTRSLGPTVLCAPLLSAFRICASQRMGKIREGQINPPLPLRVCHTLGWLGELVKHKIVTK
jgi:hypothetical protein